MAGRPLVVFPIIIAQEAPIIMTNIDPYIAPEMPEMPIHDPDMAPVEQDKTVLAGLLEEVKKDVTRPITPLVVPGRKNISVRYDPNVTSDELEAYRKRAKKAKGGDKSQDGIYFSALLLAQKCRGIVFNGELAEDDNGQPVTFTNPHLWTTLGAKSSVECVRKIYAHDAHVTNTAFKVLELAGYSDEVEEDIDDLENPT